MARSRQLLNSFRSGVLAPELAGLSDSQLHKNGLQIGRNITVQTVGGITRRAGTSFIRDYGDVKYIRLFSFQFNRDQKYLIALVIVDDSTSKMDIYRDNVLVAGDIIVPYTTIDQVDELDFAQSADSMIFVQGDFPPYYLRRKGDDATWDFIVVPIVSPPQYNPTQVEPPVLEDMWSDLLGWPQHCTFHQGRLWFAGSHTFPQNVWASVSQDFFNFALGSSEASDSIQEALDTDYINPITGITSSRQLILFTRGAEFTNPAEVLTPTSSYWLRQSNYGSEYDVKSVSVDGLNLFVDSTGRTIRALTYADERGGFDAPSVSSTSEHLIKKPKRMGVLRGSALDPANFVYVVNSDGTIAVLNISKAHELLAWVEWTTQGFYRDIVTVDDEAYILVQRTNLSSSEFVTHNGVQVTHNDVDVWYGDVEAPEDSKLVWMLERIDEMMYVDSGVVSSTLNTNGVSTFRSDANNFFGVYYETDGRGKVVIVYDGAIVFQSEYIKANPLDPFIDASGTRFSSGILFSSNDDVREQYFDKELGRSWYMHSVTQIPLVNVGRDYIGGLNHLLGQEVVSNLDGNIHDPQIVTEGTSFTTVERTYPDSTAWRYDNDNKVIETLLDSVLFSTEVIYNGASYTDVGITEYGYLISGVTGEANSIYIQKGLNRDNTSSTFAWNQSELIADSRGIKTFGNEWWYHTGDTDSNTSSGTRLSSSFHGLEDGLSVTGDTFKTGYRISNNTLVSVWQDVPAVGVVSYDPSTGLFSGESYVWMTILGFDPFKVNIFKADANGKLSFDASEGAGEPPATGLFFEEKDEVSSGQLKTVRHFEARRMDLVASSTTDAIAYYPKTSFAIGQVGLFVPIVAQTMPLGASVGAGNLVNEPKRIVAITTRYKDTQGVLVNGISIPERVFGEEALDKAPPLLTGIEKNRHLGYNRETRVTITQNDPMPFTLLSIDIELNY